MPGVASQPIVQLVSNPGSGGYAPGRIARLRAAYAAHGFEVVDAESSALNAFVPLPGAARVCIAGGDGTVRHVIGALARQSARPAIDIFPAGTINLVAREWASSRSPETFVRTALSRKPRRLYPALLNEGSFAVCASISPDARAVAEVSPALKARFGRLAYLVSMARLFVRWHRPRLQVEVDGRRLDCEAVYIAKGRYYAGPWSFAREARLDRRQLHLLALKTARRRDFMLFMLAMLAGQAHRLKNVVRADGLEIAVTGDRPCQVQADGDLVCTLPARFGIGAEALIA